MEIYYCRDKRLHRLGATSCETLASILLKEFKLDYCEVLEDGENGALIKYEISRPNLTVKV